MQPMAWPLPEGACGSWTALYTGLRKLTNDLVVHMHLENAMLFPRFETPETTIGA
jgi:regulator of cell morphogenesis and NO signaling